MSVKQPHTAAYAESEAEMEDAAPNLSPAITIRAEHKPGLTGRQAQALPP